MVKGDKSPDQGIKTLKPQKSYKRRAGGHSQNTPPLHTVMLPKWMPRDTFASQATHTPSPPFPLSHCSSSKREECFHKLGHGGPFPLEKVYPCFMFYFLVV